MEDPSLLRVLVAVAPLLALLVTAVLLPRSRLGRQLLRPIGPRVDLSAMTRGQCLRSALGFGVLGSTGIGLFALIAVANTQFLGGFDRNLPLAVVAGTYLLLGTLCLVPGLLLLAIAPFRPAELLDLAALPIAAFLKEYRSPDKRLAVRLYELPDARIVIFLKAFEAPDPEVSPDDPAHAKHWSQPIQVAIAPSLGDAETAALRIVTAGATGTDGV